MRVRGTGMFRLDGMADLYWRARGASVFDIGCNRGAVSYDMALAGAAKVDGCDIYEEGVRTARELFADLRDVKSLFEVVDLTGGPAALKPFAGRQYDITLCLATYHKLKRAMPEAALSELMAHFGRQTRGWFAWRGTSDKAAENDAEIAALDADLGRAGLARIHTSYISAELGAAAIWGR
ncbi:bifunctional 2-polyprenyl-6-hydroxyphenol methylase/3-demethylubiquinol 3-O-methyltransferase UbiG [Phenylobacterium sp.]|uniref:class I SAM-dependent methyltransferase n=1 Tax=Phenylobacterium sp. TaxID=1871053 RepID=UPI0025FB594B|nr:class I SAM-dependent methyltransferase [Phenylobacterium sp.]MBX3482527.1 class I SAM-dependent methyltransferase [Phenylobacterium sp.]MCW5758913.1 class I SAM-dependent methyltransferase [Phenylobacterium sp.]